MKREKLKALVNSVLDNNGSCNVSIDIWYPIIKDIKFLLNLGHDKIDPNNTKDSCSIFDILFDNYDHSGAPAFRCNIFCKEKEAKFMREYIKQREEVNK